MNIEQLKIDRDNYLAKLKVEHPDAFDFYSKPGNQANPTPEDWKVKETSKKSLSKKAVLNREELVFLLKRTLTGVTKKDIAQFENLSLTEVMDKLLTPVEIGSPINNYNREDVLDPEIPFGESIIEAEYNGEYEGERIHAINSWLLSELLEPKNSIHSQLWIFLTNHLAIESYGVFKSRYVYLYMKTLFDNAFGDYKALIKKITVDQAMLLYLNGHYNTKDAPDENYARELQELFCLGKGPNSKYTEEDVQAAAKILTGWRVQWNKNESAFRPWAHDTSDKQFSSFYDNKIIKGKEGEEGAEETDELIDMIFEKDEVSYFFCRELYRYFVYTRIDDWTEENVIAPLAKTFRDNNFHIGPVLRQLFMSEHFYDMANYGAMIKSPVDVLLGFWRMAGIEYGVPDDDLLTIAFVHRSMFWSMSTWGQSLVNPPNVAGFPAYYQVPNYDKAWISTNTIVRRISYTDSFLYWGFWSKFIVPKFNLLEFLKSLDNPDDPNKLIEEIEELNLGMKLSDTVRTSLKSVLLSGLDEDFYWTNAWNNFIADESNDEAKNIVYSRARNFCHRLFQLAEFQLK